MTSNVIVCSIIFSIGILILCYLGFKFARERKVGEGTAKMAGSACGPAATNHGRNINWRIPLIAYKNAPGEVLPIV